MISGARDDIGDFVDLADVRPRKLFIGCTLAGCALGTA
jgi:hypothetical protein